jgi:putative FmdB family regulatory protein
MPIYEYECQNCRRITEYMQSISEQPKRECEHCGGALEKLISPSAFHLKGGGWYKDLYASQRPSSAGRESGSESSSDTGKAGEVKTETKETKPASKVSAKE